MYAYEMFCSFVLLGLMYWNLENFFFLWELKNILTPGREEEEMFFFKFLGLEVAC